MALIDINILVRQYLPPHWRGTYKAHLCQVVCAPLHLFYRKYILEKRVILEQGGINNQMAILEYDANKTFAKEGYKIIEIIDGDSGGEVRLSLPESYKQKSAAITQWLRQRLPAGIHIHTQKKV